MEYFNKKVLEGMKCASEIFHRIIRIVEDISAVVGNFID